MLAGIILTLGSLLFAILLFVSYYSQPKILGFQNKLFRCLFMVGFLIIITRKNNHLFAYKNISYILLWSSIFVTLVAKKISCSGYATLASCGVA